MTGIDWANLSPSVAAVVMVGMVSLALFKYLKAQTLFFANHLNHLTEALEKLAKATTDLRVHCSAQWQKFDRRRED